MSLGQPRQYDTWNFSKIPFNGYHLPWAAYIKRKSCGSIIWFSRAYSTYIWGQRGRESIFASGEIQTVTTFLNVVWAKQEYLMGGPVAPSLRAVGRTMRTPPAPPPMSSCLFGIPASLLARRIVARKEDNSLHDTASSFFERRRGAL